jgi:O-antigen ligase
MLQVFVFLNILFYYSYAYLFLWEKSYIHVKPLTWYLMTLSVSLFLFLIKYRRIVIGSSAKYFTFWACLFFMYTGLSCILVSGGSPEAVQAIISLGEALALAVIFVLLFGYQKAQRSAGIAVLIVVICGVLINYIDFLTKGSLGFSTVPGRAAGFYGNPNISGNFIALGMGLSVWVLPNRWRWIFCLFVATGVFVTFSRSSMIMWVVAVFFVAWFRGFALPRAFNLVFMAVMLSVLGVTLVTGGWVHYLKQIGLGGYLDQNTSARISGGFLAQGDHSSRDRALVAELGIKRFFQSPLFGMGIGATRAGVSRVSTHNQYLQVAAELGMVGIAFLFALIWLLWYAATPPGRTTALLYTISCLFTHNNLDTPAIAVVLALGVTLGTEAAKEQKRSEAVAKKPDLSEGLPSAPRV